MNAGDDDLPDYNPAAWQAAPMLSDAEDLALREAALDRLRVRTNDGLDSLTSQEIGEFTYHGEPFRLTDAQRGIRKPAILSSAISIRTTYRPAGAREAGPGAPQYAALPPLTLDSLPSGMPSLVEAQANGRVHTAQRRD